MLILGLDTETTGLKVEDGDRIIEFCGRVYSWPERKMLVGLTQRISNQGKAINKKAEQVHGISAADLIGAPKWSDFARKLVPIFAKKPIIVAHNAAFDMGFLVHHMAEMGAPLPPDTVIFDTMSEGMTASYDAKSPSLQEFCWAMGVDYDPKLAHSAEYDVDIMMSAFFTAIDRGYFTLPEGVAAAA